MTNKQILKYQQFLRLYQGIIVSIINLHRMADTITYSKLVSIIFKKFNEFRQNPRMLIPVLEKRTQRYAEKNYMPNGDELLMVQTQEGVIPVNELIDQLRTLPRYHKFNWSYQLHCAANERARTIALNYLKVDRLQNQHEQNENIEDLVSLYADWSGSLSEHILYGFCDPIQILCELLIDDGNSDRGNRRQFLSSDLHDIGIGIEKHEKYQFVLVLIMASKAQKIARKYVIHNNHPQREEHHENNSFCHGCSIF